MIRNRFTRRLALATLPLIVTSAAIAQSPMAPATRPPAFAPSNAPMATPAADMQAVLDAQASMNPLAIEKVSPAVARLQPSAADGAGKVMEMQGQLASPDPDIMMIPAAYGAHPLQGAIVYKPATAAGPLPVVVYYHGGGWVIADVHTYDATPRFLAKQLNAIVVSVEYRHAPEAKFPAQHDDAAAAYSWALANAASWGGDPARVALAGESAGGNLAVATAIYARDHNMPLPKAILSVYPIANSDPMTPSKVRHANAKPLNSAMLKWFNYYVFRSEAETKDPRVDLVNANLRGLPPVTIVNAEIDPLLSDGTSLAAKLRQAGVSVEQRTFPDVTHEFFGMGKVVRGAYEAEGWAVERLQAALR